MSVLRDVLEKTFTTLTPSEIELLTRCVESFQNKRTTETITETIDNDDTSKMEEEKVEVEVENEEDEMENEEEAVGATTVDTDDDEMWMTAAAYGQFFDVNAEHECKFVRLLFHYHVAECSSFTERMDVSVDKYSTVPVQGPQKGVRVISIRNLAKVLKEVDSARHDVNIARTCDRIHRHSCKLCSFVDQQKNATSEQSGRKGGSSGTASILKKDPNHVMVVDDVKHCLRWCHGIDSYDLVSPVSWCVLESDSEKK